jgi:hypothetical protein
MMVKFTLKENKMSKEDLKKIIDSVAVLTGQIDLDPEAEEDAKAVVAIYWDDSGYTPGAAVYADEEGYFSKDEMLQGAHEMLLEHEMKKNPPEKGEEEYFDEGWNGKVIELPLKDALEVLSADDMSKRFISASLKFASEDDAVQYLADKVGKKIIIANDEGLSLNVTYEIITPESAGTGYFAETGFEEEGVQFDSLYEMIDYMLNGGASQPSDSGNPSVSTWYSTVDPEHSRDYFEKGEEKYYSFHPKGISEEDAKVIFESIKSGKNQAQDPDEEE